MATDASNLERINRWSAALRMFEERPMFGFGPGTYKFYYAPYQHSSQLTIISTNFGNLGNAHSEYFGPLAEMGVLGLITFLIVIGITIYKFIILYYDTRSLEMRIILMGTFLGFITYIVHGVLHLTGLNDKSDAQRREMRDHEHQVMRSLGERSRSAVVFF